MLMLLLAGNGMAACEFTVDGVRLLCSTCTCAKLTADEVKFESCIDWLARRVPSTPKRYDKILRYSDSYVTLHSRDGEEFPLASDATQKQFDEMLGQPNFKELFLRFRPAAGIISAERVENLARDLGVPVVYVKGKRGPTSGQSDVPKFEVGPQFSFLYFNNPQSIIVGHGDSQGIIGHADGGGRIIIGHLDSQGIIVGHQDCGGIIGHADNGGRLIVGHADQQGIVTGHTDQTGIGARFTYNATRNVALEAVGSCFLKRNPNLFVPGGTVFQLQLGVKAGKRFGKFGIFGKARPGLVRFSGVNRLVDTQTISFNPALPAVVVGVLRSENKTYFSTDVGGVFEFYPSRRIVLRFDLGDTIIRYGPRAGFSLTNTIIQLPAETKHNLQFSAGIGFRF